MTCPFFECLEYSSKKCASHEACAGCHIFSACEHCNRQETLIDGVKVPCDRMLRLHASKSNDSQ